MRSCSHFFASWPATQTFSRPGQERTTMTDEPTEEQAARLLKALEAQDDLSCEEARTGLSALVEAEAAGVDVDAAPEFAALLRHIDHCEGCTELYAQLAADLEALAGAAGERLEAP